MEHLVDANERAAQHDEISLTPPIPWLGFDHDMTTHLTVFIEEYPLQRDWTRGEIRRLELGEVPASRSLNETLSMIQSWLFFGLLESAFGASFRTRDYIRNLNRQDVMDTTELRICIDNYHTYLLSDQVMTSVLLEQQEAIVRSLKYAAAWNNRLAVFSAFGYPLASNSEVFTHVARLTVLVGEAVWAVGQQFPSQETRFFIDCTWCLEPGYERELKRRVTSRGWCPSLFDRMNNFARLPASFLEYMSIRPCLKVAPNYHQTCRTHCLEYNVSDPSTYQATHREGGCSCRNVRFPLQAIEDAFGASAIPIVDGDELLTSSSNNVVKFWSPSSQLKFVSFSHVWSDGLGSDTERGLPTCQVKYLRDLAMKASGTPYIWIDSLCIPRRPDLRTLAISRMSESYRSSYATIVLDNGIRRCSSTLDSYQAQLLAVSLSTWQERLWTLSESVLSRRMIFAFENDLKSSKDFLDLAGTDLHIPVIRIGCTLLDNLSHGMHTKDVTIGALQRNLCRRTSSWLDDESLAIATILGIDLAPLLEVNGDERMMKFWKMAKHVPRSIIIDSSPKFPVDGFRWAPKSMMNLKCDTMMDFQDRSATVTNDGLCGKFFLYRLQFSGTMTWSRTLTFFETSTKYCLSLNRQDNTLEYALLPGDVICFPNKLDVSIPRIGALLRPVQHGSGTQSIFRYGILATASLDPYENLHGREGFLGNLLTGALGWMGSLLTRADEEYKEIVIC
jgi:hypothetical protein